MEKYTKEKGITLIALIITIIVLIIIAAVGISLITGENGILAKAKNASDKSAEAENEENIRIAEYGNKIDEMINGSTRSGETSSISDIITAVSYTKNVVGNSVQFAITATATDSSKIMGYAIIAVNIEDSSDIHTKMSESNNLTVSGLISGKKYNVYAVVYDKYNKYKVTSSEQIEAPLVTYLYNNGNLCTDVTTGWNVMYGRYYPSSYVTLNSDNMSFYYGGYIGTGLKANYLAQYKYLNIECSSSYTRNQWTAISVKNLTGLGVNQTQGFYNSNGYKLVTNQSDYSTWAKKTFTVDISDWSSYNATGFAIECCEGRDISLYSIYLSN